MKYSLSPYDVTVRSVVSRASRRIFGPERQEVKEEPWKIMNSAVQFVRCSENVVVNVV